MKTQKKQNSNSGFTLVELMIAVALTGIATIAIYRGYVAFSQTADAQEQIVEMQQNLRIGMYRLEKDLRRAGMNEEDDENAGFTLATANTIQFTMDLGGTSSAITLEATDLTSNNPGDGDVTDIGEELSYARKDPDGDGVFGLYRNDENQNPGGNGDEIIANLEALDFVYIAESGSTITPLPLSSLNMNRIRSVQVSMVVRTTNEDYRYTDKIAYRNINPDVAGGEIILDPQNDNFRRRVISKQIKIRNAGL